MTGQLVNKLELYPSQTSPEPNFGRMRGLVGLLGKTEQELGIGDTQQSVPPPTVPCEVDSVVIA